VTDGLYSLSGTFYRNRSGSPTCYTTPAISPLSAYARLRQLEQAGIIEREKHENRREVWYKLTPAGQDLNPVVEALSDWGLQYAMCSPRPGEVVLPDRVMTTLAASLNKRGWKNTKTGNLVIRFPAGRSLYLFI